LGPKKQYTFNGKQVTGQQVDVESSNESWNTYKLEDGAVLKIKSVLLDVVRLDEYDKEGNPVYQFTAHQIIGVTPPDELKKKHE
jgi:hypothetical protein